MMPGQSPRQPHCHHGHPYDEANTRWRKDGSRQCRTCALERERARMRRLERKAVPADGQEPSGSWDRLPWASENALDNILAATVRQAIHDVRAGYRHKGTPDAETFLRQMGMIRTDGTWDLHGHTPAWLRRKEGQ